MMQYSKRKYQTRGGKMPSQVIKDKLNNTLGYIVAVGSGTQKATDKSNRTLGYYDPRRDVTTDASNRVQSRGNTLAGLIMANAAGKR
jgi:hypothetical protein